MARRKRRVSNRVASESLARLDDESCRLECGRLARGKLRRGLVGAVSSEAARTGVHHRDPQVGRGLHVFFQEGPREVERRYYRR